MPNPFAAPGSWLRGNLHTHTNRSDGQYEPQFAVDTYAELGYDFLAITDHLLVTPPEELDARGLVLIPGVELFAPGGAFGGWLHVVALGVDHVTELNEAMTPAEAVARIALESELCFLCHPFWSLTESAALLDLEGHVGLEVFNATGLNQTGRGGSEIVWDVLLGHGQTRWGLAVDDAHSPRDLGVGWICAKSEERSRKGILAAVRAGNFYASTGPELRDLTREGDRVHISCSPCREAYILGAAVGAGRSTAGRDDLIVPFEEVSLSIPTQEAWLRVEVVDEYGYKAWSNPFYPSELD
ncbi:MAG TPA: hypothetical protein VGM19_03395 [Armatimonadota bacterium]|jgi:hypothetical protein